MKIGSGKFIPEIPLPAEILVRIAGYLDDENEIRSLRSCCLVSREWYRAFIEALYRRPALEGGRFALFLRTITGVAPNNNLSHKIVKEKQLHRHNLNEFVQVLDMGNLAHESSPSRTAKLLHAVKGSLRAFKIPAQSFTTACCTPLLKCEQLRKLDLSSTQRPLLLQDMDKVFLYLENLRTLETCIYWEGTYRDAMKIRLPKYLVNLIVRCRWNQIQGALEHPPKGLKRLSFLPDPWIGMPHFFTNQLLPDLSRMTNLRHLSIEYDTFDNREYRDEHAAALAIILTGMESLETLSLPDFAFSSTFFDVLTSPTATPRPNLHEISFSRACDFELENPPTAESAQEYLNANTPLSAIRRIELPVERVDELDRAIGQSITEAIRCLVLGVEDPSKVEGAVLDEFLEGGMYEDVGFFLTDID